MTDPAPAYAQAIDQLRRERDALRAQFEAVTAERDAAIAAREDANENVRGWVEEHARLEKRLKAVTAERGTDNIRHDFAAASQENIRLRLAIENLKTMFHAAIDAAGRTP